MNANSESTGTAGAASADAGSINGLIAKLKDPDDAVRTQAWQSAANLGAQGVRPLGGLMVDSDLEVARAAKRGLWHLVRHAGRPRAEADRKAVSAELAALLDGASAPVRHEVLWMLSEIGDAAAVRPIAAFLRNPEAREDARAVLERIPGKESLAALQAALDSSPEEFRPALANSLRVRGVQVSGYPSQKLVPTRPGATAGAKNI